MNWYLIGDNKLYCTTVQYSAVLLKYTAGLNVD